MKDLKIALVQMFSEIGNFEYNINKIEVYSREASKNGVHIICFPELSICGYSIEKACKNGKSLPNEVIDYLSRVSVNNKIIIIAGICEKEEFTDKLFITQIICFPNGRVEKYRKTYLGNREKRVFSQGNEIKIYKSIRSKFGVQICYDAHFPELSTIQSLMGAEIIFMPHASPLGGKERRNIWNKYLIARAYDNSVYVAACNHIYKNEYNEYCGGGSIVIDPKGNIIAEKFTCNEGILYANLSSEVINKIRYSKGISMTNNFYLKDRRKDLNKI